MTMGAEKAGMAAAPAEAIKAEEIVITAVAKAGVAIKAGTKGERVEIMVVEKAVIKAAKAVTATPAAPRVAAKLRNNR